MKNELDLQSRLRPSPAEIAPNKQLVHGLVLSASESTRNMISAAIAQAGWEPIVHADMPGAQQTIQRTRFQMAWVDVSHDPTSSECRDLCETIAAMPDVLLAICGHADDPQEEIWARQLGPWLYLPGASLDDNDEIRLLCEQALLILSGNRGISLPG